MVSPEHKSNIFTVIHLNMNKEEGEVKRLLLDFEMILRLQTSLPTAGETGVAPSGA